MAAPEPCLIGDSGWDCILAGPRPRRTRRGWRIVAALLLAIGGILLGLTPLIGCWPLVAQVVHAHVQAESGRAAIADNRVQRKESQDRLAAAREYNRRLLLSGQPVLGEVVDPFDGTLSGDFSGDDDEEYTSQLNHDHGIMAVVEVPSIGVNMPVRHGSDAETLERGAGHLHGTSLPVGGRGTHSVITAHRGLRTKLMFTRLDELEAGDVIIIHVEGVKLVYGVDRISVIDPDNTGVLRASDGEDRLTLMTCTPYGVNTQRLLVSGTRITVEGTGSERQVDRGLGMIDGLVATLVTLVTGMAGSITITVLRRGRRIPDGVPPRHLRGSEDVVARMSWRDSGSS